MKKIIYIALVSVLISSCGSKAEDIPAPKLENKAPTSPVLKVPPNGGLCIDNTVNFQWESSSDPEGDEVSYELQVSKDNQFSQIDHNFMVTGTIRTISLEKGIAYYWRVKATDENNLSSSFSANFNFYTEGEREANHLPFSPELVKPVIGETIQTTKVTLEWNASDVDNTDMLSYDVYFGTENPPTTRISENQNEKMMEVDINDSTNYYWRIIVKDDKGGEAIGQIWKFKTD